jgi:hypothetical protein
MLAILKFLPDSVTSGRWRFSPSPPLIRVAAWFFVALVVGGVLASWFWQLAAPDTAPRSEAAQIPDHQAAATAVVSRHLFGRPSAAGDETGGERSGVSLRLLGAMTASPKVAGFAILAEEGKPSMAVVEGETFIPGATLLEVLPGRVRVKSGDRVETIEMTKSATTSQPGPGERGGSARPGGGLRPEGVRP